MLMDLEEQQPAEAAGITINADDRKQPKRAKKRAPAAPLSNG